MRARGSWLLKAQKETRHLARHTLRTLVRYKQIFAWCAAVTVLWFLIAYIPHHKSNLSNVVIILGANKGGGVLQWKGAKDWELERISLSNKKDYAALHGYTLAVKDTKAKRRYTHEWRESWEKVDIIKETMDQYPLAEWFWWVDLETYIMEPQISLEQHVFDAIPMFERNVSHYNPLNLDLALPYVDEAQPPSMILSQDCGGFSLGSFFIKRGEWAKLLMDVLWDPVVYEQKHSEWTHNEQAALQYYYSELAWIRSGIAFAPLRQFNAFPPGACSEASGDARFFYNEGERDFIVNMAGCQWNRDCLQEMEEYRDLHHKKARSWRRWWRR